MKKPLIVALIIVLQGSFAFATQKVAVVGAGLAGLTTAYRLHQAGYDVEVFEARERVGGRVFTVNMNGSLVELGGQNIDDGGDGANLVALAAELGLSIDNDEMASAHYLYDEASGKVFDFYRDLMPDFVPLSFERRQELQWLELESPTMREVLDGFFTTAPSVKEMFSFWLRSYEGSEPQGLSPHYAQLSFLWMLENAERNYARLINNEAIIYKNRGIGGGNAKLPEELARRLGTRVHLKKPVLGLAKDAGKYVLRFADKSEFHANVVVLSVPASVLKDIEVDSHAIPESVLEKMRGLSYGTIAKILVPVKNTDGLFGSVSSSFSGSWFSKDRKVLTLYLAGDGATMHKPDDFTKHYERASKGIIATYQGFQMPQAPSFNAPREEQFSSYVTTIGMSWAVEPYTRGGYSNYAPDQYALRKKTIQVDGETVGVLFAPINDAIFFAGEHTALENPATMEGAVESGESAARVIKKRVPIPIQ